MDLVYGRRRTFAKFKVLEIVARVPYQAWENVAYVALTHRFARPKLARRIFERVQEVRSQQDNEQWHLLILAELIQEQEIRQGIVRYQIFPQILAFAYYQISWLLYAVHPKASYRLNADFEDHAEHEYMLFVEENVELATQPYRGEFSNEYGSFASLADLFTQIGLDERHHKDESIERMMQPRFS